MGQGVVPKMSNTVRQKTSPQHIYIMLPGERYARCVIKKNSLLYLAYTLDRMYVEIHGLSERTVDVRTLSADLLKRKVICYKIETDMTFSVVLEGLGWERWKER